MLIFDHIACCAVVKNVAIRGACLDTPPKSLPAEEIGHADGAAPLRPVSVLKVGRMHYHDEQQAPCID